MSGLVKIDMAQHRAAADLAFALGMKAALSLQAAGVDRETIAADAEQKLKDAMETMRAWWMAPPEPHRSRRPDRKFYWHWPREGMAWFMWARQNYGSRWIVWRVGPVNYSVQVAEPGQAAL